MKSLNEEIKQQNTTQIKIFNSGSKGIATLELQMNNWLLENSNINIIDIKTTSTSYGGSESFFDEDLYLIVIYN